VKRALDPIDHELRGEASEHDPEHVRQHDIADTAEGAPGGHKPNRVDASFDVTNAEVTEFNIACFPRKDQLAPALTSAK
jgi:hypothetical protein